MYDPEEKNGKSKSNAPIPKPTDASRLISPSQLESEKEIFRANCEMFEAVRMANGVMVKKGEIKVINQEKLDKLSIWQKDVLREVCKKLVREFENANKFWRDK